MNGRIRQIMIGAAKDEKNPTAPMDQAKGKISKFKKPAINTKIEMFSKQR